MSIFAVGEFRFAFGPRWRFFCNAFRPERERHFYHAGDAHGSCLPFSASGESGVRPPPSRPLLLFLWASIRPALYPMSLLLGMIMFRSWTHIGLITFIPFTILTT